MPRDVMEEDPIGAHGVTRGGWTGRRAAWRRAQVNLSTGPPAGRQPAKVCERVSPCKQSQHHFHKHCKSNKTLISTSLVLRGKLWARRALFLLFPALGRKSRDQAALLCEHLDIAYPSSFLICIIGLINVFCPTVLT